MFKTEGDDSMMIREQHNLTIRRQSKGKIPNLPFLEVKNTILGKDYELSLVFPTLATSKELHTTWKKKNTPVNVLAFPLDEKEGEIIITLFTARIEAKKFNHGYLEHVLFLFIHACLHLKGFKHSDIMEEYEQTYLRQFMPK